MAQDEASKKAHENTLWKIAGNIVTKYYEFIPNLIKAQWDQLEKQFPKPGTETWKTWAQYLVETDRMDQDTANELKKLIDYPFPLNVIYFIGAVLAVTKAELEAVMSIHALDKQYDLLGHTTPHPAPLDNLVRSMIIDPGRSTENRAELKRLGYSEGQIDNIVLSYYRTIDEGTLRTLYLRGEINESRLYERMRELGYTDQRTSEITRSWEVLPGPQDLFTMVAHEAFEPDIYNTLGLNREFPSEQVEWLEKQGISRAWAEKYWIAHWEQPSIGQGFEMLHRDVISEAELDMLFRAVEIPDYWRGRLTQIAYSPYTRVDVRRMHDLDILSDEDLIRAYMDLGYDSDKAYNMARFTIEYNAANEKELTRSTILSSYKEGIISRSDATDLLTQQGYSNDLADYYITLQDYNRDKELQDKQIENTRDGYLLNLRTQAETRSRLNSMGLRGDTIDTLMESWDLDRYKYQTTPSKSELDRFLAKGIIDEGQWRENMTRLGYTFQQIAWYWEDILPERSGTTRLPTKAELKRWLEADRIDRDTYIAEMKTQGYADRYIDLYIND